MDWISHVKAVQKKKGISYKEALKVASASYKKKGAKKGAKKIPKKMKGKM